jgi:hypothetical protein
LAFQVRGDGDSHFSNNGSVVAFGDDLDLVHEVHLNSDLSVGRFAGHLYLQLPFVIDTI